MSMTRRKPGAVKGRPPKYIGGMRTTSVRLPAALEAVAVQLGDGDLSAGVRVALVAHLPSSAPARTVQVWRRKADGARFAVLLDGGVPVAAQPLAEGAPLPALGDGGWDGALSDVLDAARDRGEVQEKAARIAALHLLAGELGGVPKTELAAALGVSRWTLDRDLAALPEVAAQVERILALLRDAAQP